ncbi:response regulator [Nisaea sp.]|uniref:response regulator n=1 Tax=Nisaea sp. TaxID=2024842 RepID=UPI0032985A78
MPNILLIEDMKGVQTSMAMILTNAGYSVTTADNGRHGIETFETKEFDLVITDILMPEMDGSEVLFALMKKPSKPPMIAISAGGGSINASEALRFASKIADAVLEKPFSRNELLEVVERLTSSPTKS